MGIKNRDTLKNYFKNGNVPREYQFWDLIDSNLNMRDEGFDKSPLDGFKVSQLDDDGKLISFYRAERGSKALYHIKIDRQNNLVIGSDENPSLLYLSTELDEENTVRVGINTESPERELDVAGVVRSTGRIGVPSNSIEAQQEVLADGGWHDITEDLEGCQAFEVMAGAGGQKRRGKYALMHALVMNTYNPKGWLFNLFNSKNKIKYHHAYYRSRADKLKLRWFGSGGQNSVYRLQIKSNTDYGTDVEENPIKLRYYVTRLWFDVDMSDSRTIDV